MNPIKVNFKSAHHYLNALGNHMQNCLDILKFFYEKQYLKNFTEKESQEWLFFFYQSQHHVLIFFETLDRDFKQNVFTDEERKLLNWFRQMMVDRIVQDNPEMLNHPEIARNKFSFVDKKKS